MRYLRKLILAGSLKQPKLSPNLVPNNYYRAFSISSIVYSPVMNNTLFEDNNKNDAFNELPGSDVNTS